MAKVLLVTAGEREKLAKYQDLAADLARQWQGFSVVVIPVVLGDLGVITNLKRYLFKSRSLARGMVDDFMAKAQVKVLCDNVQLIKRHMKKQMTPPPLDNA